MATVWIPSLLRGLTGDHESVTVAGCTVHQLIAQIEALYPGFRPRVTAGDTLRAGLAVVVDGQVATLGLMQPVLEDSEVHFLPAIGGGANQFVQCSVQREVNSVVSAAEFRVKEGRRSDGTG
jgi:molybdopterin synthase sulfur carrier subunit